MERTNTITSSIGKLYRQPARELWPGLLARTADFDLERSDRVKMLLADVQNRGDKAIRMLAERFDGYSADLFKVSEEEFQLAEEKVDASLKEAIGVATDNIEKFHSKDIPQEVDCETMPGVRCWSRWSAVDRVGLYVPGGNAPLFSTVLMLGVPARIAGCAEVVVCTPPDPLGRVDPAILYAARSVGIQEVFKLGGVQAIGAMLFGCSEFGKVDKIFGPGNSYVTEAKRQASRFGVDIDMPAGPSEVLVVGDADSNVDFLAADLLAQAEHGADSACLMVSLDEGILSRTQERVCELLETSPSPLAQESMAKSRFIAFAEEADLMDFVNQYAPEHLIINTRNAGELAGKVRNAGSVFVGENTPESAGDYASGTNHTLPTSGWARSASGVSVSSFMKRTTFQEIDPDGARCLLPTVELMATAEQLPFHAMAAKMRLS